MIKINLAKRRQVASLAEPKSAKTGGLAFLKEIFSRQSKTEINLDAVKELPIRRVAMLAAAGLFASYALDLHKEEELKKWGSKVAKVSEEQSKLKVELAKAKGYEDLKRNLEADERVLRTKIETIQKLLQDRHDSPKMLLTLSNVIPPEVWLKSLRIENSQVNFQGYALGFNPISDFMKSLNESAYFNEVKLQSTQREREEAGMEVAGFELVAKKR